MHRPRPPRIARHRLRPPSHPPLKTDDLRPLERRLKTIVSGIITRMESAGTEEILSESFNYLTLLLKEKSKYSTGD